MSKLGMAAIGWRVGEQFVLCLEVCLKRFLSLLILIPLQLSYTAIPVCMRRPDGSLGWGASVFETLAWNCQRAPGILLSLLSQHY